jgi:5'-nucleotidase
LFQSDVYATDTAFQDENLRGKTVIIHTNDIHGKVIYGQSQSLGIKTVAALKERCIQAGAEVILLDAGDTLIGTTIANYNQGSTIVELMNAVGYDAMVSGNHDYEYGYEHLRSLANQMEFPMLGANVTDFNTNKLFLKDNLLIERNGVTYGIFGLVTTTTMNVNKSENVAGIQVLNPVVVAQLQVQMLKAKGADVIIALCHVGIKAQDEVDCLDIIRRVQGIDIVIDGHSHTSLSDCIKANKNPNTLYVSTGCHLRAIGVIVIDPDGSKRAYELTELKLYKAGLEAEFVGEGKTSDYLKRVLQITDKAEKEISNSAHP